MKLTVTTGLILPLGSTCLHAQQALVGSYSGSFTKQGRAGNLQGGVTLQITSAENGALKATAIRGSAGLRGTDGCAGQYELAGTYQGDKLQLKSTAKGGGAGDCGLSFQLTADGNKLVGKMGQLDVQLSK